MRWLSSCCYWRSLPLIRKSARKRFSRTMSSQQLRRPVHLVLDYDCTLTVKDTMVVLGGLPKEPQTTWKAIVDAYMADYNVYKETPYPWKTYDSREYSGWLAARKWVEAKSVRRVQDANFFKGVTLQEVETRVKQTLFDRTLELRAGWTDLFTTVLSSDSGEVSIVSVNWSETSIRLALLHSVNGSTRPDKERLAKHITSMDIHANEIAGLDELEGSSGQVVRPWGEDIRTSDDKLRHLPKMKENESLLVYVGDSSTDFDCLCAAKLGVWLCDVPESQYPDVFKQTFAPFDRSGFVPPPLHSLKDVEKPSALFYWSPDLTTITTVLRGESDRMNQKYL